LFWKETSAIEVFTIKLAIYCLPRGWKKTMLGTMPLFIMTWIKMAKRLALSPVLKAQLSVSVLGDTL
jgi:hypothetical protein